MSHKLFSFFILLYFLGASLIHADNAKPLGKIISIRGQVYWANVKKGIKARLKKGDWIYLGAIVTCAKKSEALIEMEGGMMKLIPEDSTLMFFDKESWEMYQKTDKSIKKIFSVIGKKAESKENTAKDKIREKIIRDFENGDYYLVIQTVDSVGIKLNSPEWLYWVGVSFLNLGDEKRSLNAFEKLLEIGGFEYKMQSRYGIFINLLRLKQFKKAKEILDTFGEEGRIYNEMESLWKETQIDETQ